MTWALLALAALLGALWFVRLPYYSEGPGPARNVEPLIQVDGHAEYPSEGRFILTSVSQFGPLNPYELLAAKLDSSQSILREDEVIPPDQTSEQQAREAVSQMDQSQVDATAVVLADLSGYPKNRGEGVLVEGVVPGCPADGRLYPTDLVKSINGTPVADASAASDAIDAIESDTPIEFRVQQAGQTEDVKLTRAPCGEDGELLVGVSMIDNFPFGVKMSSGSIGGPSAGLMWALGLYDLLTPGDLTDGRTIAGTGVIDGDGKVYPIGGVGKKIIAAQRAGAELFLVPSANLTEAQASTEGIPLVPVDSFAGALSELTG